MYEITERVFPEQPTAVVRGRVCVTDLPTWIGPSFGLLTAAVRRAGLAPTGPPFVRYWRVPDTAAEFDVEAGLPLDRPLPSVDGAPVQPGRLPGGPVAVTLHTGPYEAIVTAYEALDKWIADAGGTLDGAPWEIYLDPPVGDPETWRTQVVQPLRIG